MKEKTPVSPKDERKEEEKEIDDLVLTIEEDILGSDSKHESNTSLVDFTGMCERISSRPLSSIVSPRNISPIIPGTPKNEELSLFTPIRDQTPSMASEIKNDVDGLRFGDEFEIISDISSAVVHGAATKGGKEKEKEKESKITITSPPN